MYSVTLKTFPSPSWLLSSSTPPFPFCPTKTSIITHNLVALVLVFYRPTSLKGLRWIWEQAMDASLSFLLIFLSLSPFPSLSPFASLSPQFFLLYPLFLTSPFPFAISLLYSSFSLPCPKLNIWKSSCYQSLIETELVTFKQLEGLTEHFLVVNTQLGFVMGDGLLECNIIKSLKCYPYLHWPYWNQGSGWKQDTQNSTILSQEGRKMDQKSKDKTVSPSCTSSMLLLSSP